MSTQETQGFEVFSGEELTEKCRSNKRVHEILAMLGSAGGDFSIKLEDQISITQDGVENLNTYPFD